jgi:cation-transporting ATPase E
MTQPSKNIDSLPPVSVLTGLSVQQIAQQRAAGQGNRVELQSSRPYRQILRETLFTLINGVFFLIAMVLILLGRGTDAITVLLIIGASTSVNLFQEVRAKRKLDRIALLTRPRVMAIRDGQRQALNPDEIVLGDLLVLEPGDQVVVDGVMVGPGVADLDESLLTGESDLVAKQAGDEIHSGSFCVNGSATYQVTKVGVDTLAYKLTTGARAFRQIYTPLQREINVVIQVLLLVAIFFWILYLISYIIGAISLQEVVQVAAVVAGLVPSGLYLTITLAYALGAVRLAGQDAVIQQANAIESLSNVEVVCLDKTGTLTSNRINLRAVYPLGLDPDEAELRRLLGNFAAGASSGNRTNEAIRQSCPGQRPHLQHEVPFSSVRKWSALAWADTLYVLGAPEMLASALSVNEEALALIARHTDQGFRVLLFAATPLISVESQPSSGDESFQLPPLSPLGLVVFSDELRPNIRKTLQNFIEAGVELKIISGDNPHTVAALARQAGLPGDPAVVSGMELAEMADARFDATAKETTIFGRVTPEQKFKLVRSLRRQGAYVAMVGDGVNDVLAMKEANLSISMESGSQITRGIAAIILMRDSFEALPHAFIEGQRIRNGVQETMNLFLVRIFTYVLLIFAIELVTGTFPLLIRHNAVVTTLVVGIPTIGVAWWAKAGQPEQRGMVRSALHFTLPAILTLAITGLMVYLGYLIAVYLVTPVPDGFISPQMLDQLLSVPRSALVTILVMCGLLLIPFLKPPTRLWVGGQAYSGDWRYTYMAIAMMTLYFLVVFIPPLQEISGLARLGVLDYVVLAGVAFGWAITLRTLWRKEILDRFLGITLK